MVRTLMEDTPDEDDLVLVSRDATTAIATSQFSGRIKAHLELPKNRPSPSWGRGMAEWLKDQSVDLCHFHLSGTYGWWAGSWNSCPIVEVARYGIPTVATNHSASSFFSPTSGRFSLFSKLAAASRAWPGKARQLAAVRWEAAVSQHDLAVTLRSFSVFKSKLVKVYHSRLDSAEATSKPFSSRIILNVGTIAFIKGQDLLVEAFALNSSQFADWQLHLVGYFGENACVARIRHLISRHHLENRVILHGPKPDPTGYYCAAEVYVQPSLVEGLGLSLQEAMFHGCACIGSDCGGIPELISNSSVGVLFHPGDVKHLSRELATLMNDEDKRHSLGHAARDSIIGRGMTRQTMSETYRGLYQKALA